MLVRTAPVVYPPSSPPAAEAATSSMSRSPSASRPSSTRNMARRITPHARRFAVARALGDPHRAIDQPERSREVPPRPRRVGVRDREVAVGRSGVRERLGPALEQLLGALQPGRGDGVLHVRDVLAPQRERAQRRSLVIAPLQVRRERGLAERDRLVGMPAPVRGLGEAVEVIGLKRLRRRRRSSTELVGAIPRPVGDAVPRLVEPVVGRPGHVHHGMVPRSPMGRDRLHSPSEGACTVTGPPSHVVRCVRDPCRRAWSRRGRVASR